MLGTSIHHDTIVTLEREVQTAACRAHRDRLAELLHDEFYEHGASGRTWTRAAVLGSLPDAPLVEGRAQDFASRDLAPGVVLLTYRIEGARTTTRSSLWTRQGDSWRMIFHQGTLSTPLRN